MDWMRAGWPPIGWPKRHGRLFDIGRPHKDFLITKNNPDYPILISTPVAQSGAPYSINRCDFSCQF